MVNGHARIEAGDRFGDHDLPAQRRDREVDADHAPTCARPGAGGADDGVGRDVPGRGAHGGDPVAVRTSMPVTSQPRQQRGAGAAGRRGVAEHDRLRGAVPVVGE